MDPYPFKISTGEWVHLEHVCVMKCHNPTADSVTLYSSGSRVKQKVGGEGGLKIKLEIPFFLLPHPLHKIKESSLLFYKSGGLHPSPPHTPPPPPPLPLPMAYMITPSISRYHFYRSDLFTRMRWLHQKMGHISWLVFLSCFYGGAAITIGTLQRKWPF